MTRRGRAPRKRAELTHDNDFKPKAIRGKDTVKTTWLQPSVLNPEDCDECTELQACEQHCPFCSTGQSCETHHPKAA